MSYIYRENVTEAVLLAFPFHLYYPHPSPGTLVGASIPHSSWLIQPHTLCPSFQLTNSAPHSVSLIPVG